MKRILIHLLVMIIASLVIAIISLLLTHNNLFSTYGIGYMLSQVAILTGVSFLIGGVPGLIVYLVKKKPWKGFFAIIWIAWVILGILSLVGQVLQNMNG